MNTFICLLVLCCSFELYSCKSIDLFSSYNTNGTELETRHRDRRAERLWFCVQITLEKCGKFEIIGADKPWGKWVAYPFGDKVPSPYGLTFQNDGDNHLICSAGRSDSATGTEVTLDIWERQTNAKWKIYWDVPFSGANTFNWRDYDSSKMIVTHEEHETDWHKFKIASYQC